MKKLLSLPPNAAGSFHKVTDYPAEDYYVTSDPADRKLGSGGGTTWLLNSCHAAEAPQVPFAEWLARERRILLHAGGQSRRLPAYAACGKVLTPVPVFRWARGQEIAQNLLDLQLPLYEKIMQKAPAGIHTLVASGDVYLRSTGELQPIPDADVVCYGLWADTVTASHHGVFMISRENPTRLDFMLQKPDAGTQARLMSTHFLLMDIGIWLLSDKAVARLQAKAPFVPTQAADGSNRLVCPQFPAYDLYSQFGCALGEHPSQVDPALSDLSVAILPLPGGEFYHFGTAPELISSSLAIQNLVKDQRFIIQKGVKRQAAVFTQNALLHHRPGAENTYLWVENSYMGEGWHYTAHNIVTGVPENDWHVSLADGVCLDIVPIGESSYALRPYGYEDAFRGDVEAATTHFLGHPVREWLDKRGIAPASLGQTGDLQAARLFPVSADLSQLEILLNWFLADEPSAEVTALWEQLPRLSADEISAQANLERQAAQREAYRRENLQALAANWQRSVFYQTDLKDMAARFVAAKLPLPAPLPAEAPLMTQMHDAMFRSEYLRGRGDETAAAQAYDKAFALLRESLTEAAERHKCFPKMSTYSDQIVWARSPVRIDVAGGWTDTPPYSLLNGGNVVNVAIELNGQPPLQVYVKPCAEKVIICRSIDLGAMERIETFEELQAFHKVGSPFSIPKAALSLAGFLPRFGGERFGSLREQLEAFGSGLEITLLSAIPAGSGLGTSSILASTVLGALSDFCALGWDKNEIANRTLVLEQLLTTGGGWQDQYGGVLHGVKLLQTVAGTDQSATARWLPDTLFCAPELRACHLLYYTGVTRTAKHILTEIVRGMFLNSRSNLALLDEMKVHALAMFDALQLGDFDRYGQLLRETWRQNKCLDSGTNPPVIEALCQRVDDLCAGYKLPGAGGGGFLYMVAKDPQAALRIQQELTEHPLCANARFVRMDVSQKGLQVSRS